MTAERDIYRRKQKPKYLLIYSYRYIPVIYVFYRLYLASITTGEGAYLRFILKCFLVGLVILIWTFATRSVSELVNEIIIDNSEGTIELKYFKGFFLRRERSESCVIKYIKYFYDCRLDKHGKPLEQVVSIEMPSGNYFILRELRGFNKSELEQLVKSFESFNGRKFNS